MPKNKDLKRLVRSRMQKTGESYTTARRHLTKNDQLPSLPVGKYAEVAGMSDAAVQKATGHTWTEWVKRLDAAHAHAMDHRDIARHLRETYDQVSPWWAQSVTVGYERIKGLREAGQRRGGNFDVNKSKTVPLALHDLYRAFSDVRLRRQWMGEVDLTVRKNNVDKSVRWKWEDGTPVEVYFWEKGPEKAQAQLQHRELPTKKAAEATRSEWTERFEALARWAKERG